MNLATLNELSKLASDISAALHSARDGGMIAKFVAGVEIAGLIANRINDESDEFTANLAKWRGKPGNLAVEMGANDKWTVTREEYEADYVGAPDPKVIADELRREGKKNATLVIAGATGSGKSTLARKIGNNLSPKGKQIRLPGDIFRQSWSVKGIRAVYETLSPAVLIFDDVSPSGVYARPEVSHTQLRILEALTYLRGKCVVVFTVMEDTVEFTRGVEKGEIGVAYYSGLRPGRVDRFILLLPPDAEKIRAIMKHHGLADPPEELVKRLEGLSGAYIAEAARVYLKYPKDWEDRVKILRMTSPRAFPVEKTRQYKSFWERLTAIEARLRIEPYNDGYEDEVEIYDESNDLDED